MVSVENEGKSPGLAELRWQVHLARRAPKRLGVVLVALLGVPLIAYLLFRHWLMAVAGFWMIFSACAEFLLPVRYSMSEQGVRQRTALGVRVMNWSEVKRVVASKGGVLLSPFAQPSRLDAFRGIFLWYGDQEAKIQEALSQWAPPLQKVQVKNDEFLAATADGRTDQRTD